MSQHDYEYDIDIQSADSIAGGRYGFVASIVELRRRHADGTVQRFRTPLGQYHGETTAEAESRAREGVERWIAAQDAR